jgi:hypothetical protein
MVFSASKKEKHPGHLNPQLRCSCAKVRSQAPSERWERLRGTGCPEDYHYCNCNGCAPFVAPPLNAVCKSVTYQHKRVIFRRKHVVYQRTAIQLRLPSTS